MGEELRDKTARPCVGLQPPQYEAISKQAVPAAAHGEAILIQPRSGFMGTACSNIGIVPPSAFGTALRRPSRQLDSYPMAGGHLTRKGNFHLAQIVREIIFMSLAWCCADSPPPP